MPLTQGHQAASFAQRSGRYWTAEPRVGTLEQSETGFQLLAHSAGAAGKPVADREVRHGTVPVVLLLLNQKELPCSLRRLSFETKHPQGADILSEIWASRLYFSAPDH